MRNLLIASAALLAAAGLAACEEAGEKMDNALEEADGGPRDLRDGALEKAGEAIDNTIGVERNDPADSLSDAVDNDRASKPN